MQEVYSYSKLVLFETCPYAFYKKYILGQKMAGNPLSDYGKMVHKILEEYYNGIIKKEDLVKIYEERFKESINVPIRLYFDKFVSKDLTFNYYNKAHDYFENFEELNKSYNILAVEENFENDIDDFKINGVIDLVLQDYNGNIVVIDHKSSNKYSRSELAKKQKQLYLYCYAIREKYGKYPNKLIYNFFNNQTLLEVPFNFSDYQDTILWTIQTVSNIRNAEKYLKDKNNKFFCYTLCGFNKNCVWKEF